MFVAAGLGGAEARELRVCADPNNLPFSNKAGEGFENKIAAIVAKDLGATLHYTW
jgi:mxaJ protein